MPNKILRVALVGLGRVAVKHIKALQFQEKLGAACLVAAVDRDLAKGQELLAELSARSQGSAAARSIRELPLYADLSTLLSQEKPDIVALCTPSGLHAAGALEALAAGCHLLVEKPLALTLADCESIVKQAQAQQRHVVMGHIYRYFPLLRQLQADIAAGVYGQVLYGQVSVRWGHGQDYYDLAPWRGSKAMDGGVIMNQCVHALDLMRWLMLASETSAVVGRCDLLNHKMECEDFGLGIYQFNNGSWLALEGSSCGDPEGQEASFYLALSAGEIRARLWRGKVKVDIRPRAGKNQLWRYLSRELRATYRAQGWGGLRQLGNPHTAIYADLIQAVQKGKQGATLADATAGLEAVKMVLQLYEAAGRM